MSADKRTKYLCTKLNVQAGEKMKKYIAEIAGKDSVSAVIKFMKENPGTVVIPTIVYTGTEYGDRESYYNSCCSSTLKIQR